MNINLTIIGQIVAFIAFVAFCMRYVWPPILAAMEERQQKIADGLAAADRAGHDLELAQKAAVDRLADAKKEAAVIVDSANKRAATLVDEVNVDAFDFCEEVVELAEPTGDSIEVIVGPPVVNELLLVG